MTSSTDVLLGALALGLVTGMRSTLAPAMTSRALAAHEGIEYANEPARTLASHRAQQVLLPMAAAELLGDKMPFAPDRTIVPSLMFRALSGGVTAAALASMRREPLLLPALIGATAAPVGWVCIRRGSRLPLVGPWRRCGFRLWLCFVAGLTSGRSFGAGRWSAACIRRGSRLPLVGPWWRYGSGFGFGSVGGPTLGRSFGARASLRPAFAAGSWLSLVGTPRRYLLATLSWAAESRRRDRCTSRPRAYRRLQPLRGR